MYTVDGKRMVVPATEGVDSTEEAQEIALKKAGWHPAEAKNASGKSQVSAGKARKGKPKEE